ncbi:MAG: DUF445 family protein [Acidimicrobiia bacterium]|nr:DUF445 family protein [Acidimicrobiia bacterium]
MGLRLVVEAGAVPTSGNQGWWRRASRCRPEAGPALSWAAVPDAAAPLPSLGDEEGRRRQLRQMKARATGLLLLAAGVFVAARLFEEDHGWLGYVRATAEAAMVGGLADWFAVTALFRHPLRIPIPHTAIIPTRKDQLGHSLGSFVEDNFLAGPVIAEKLRSAQVANRVAAWLLAPGNATVAARHTSAALAGAAEVLRDEDVQSAIESGLIGRLRKVQAAPLAGKVLEIATAEGRHTEMVDATLAASIRFIDEKRESLRSRFGRESPWWVPEPIDSRIFEKLYGGLRSFLTEVAGDPEHEFRRYLDERAAELAQRLQHDPELIARGELWKEELLRHPAVASWSASLWSDLKATLQKQAEDPASELRRRIEQAAATLGRSLRDDPELQAKVDGWIESTVLYVVEQERHQLAELISGTVARWDPDEASERIELQVGRDLQFIRINGTLVGGLAGLGIHAIGQLIG